MRNYSALIIPLLLHINPAPAQTGASASVTANGWTVAADGDRGALAVSHDGLGPVMNEVRLSVRDGASLKRLSNWSVESSGRRLTIRTTHPATAWLFEPGPDVLKIVTTMPGAVITAYTPASSGRVVARILDPREVPVDWMGTNEVAASYGGKQTRNPSFLPRRNPDVMYFALGAVSSREFHSLFDRKTDTAISFSEETRLHARPDRAALELEMPVPGSTAVRLIPDYYTKTLGLPYYKRFDDTHFPTAPALWSSWTSYYASVTEGDIVRNADWLAEHLKPYGFQYVQLDDGYDRGARGEHYWIEKWDATRFPHGPEWLANYIRRKGLHAGIWLVPNAYAGAVEQHPDWYLRDTQGNLVPDYSTPSLDSTDPEVLSFLRKLFTTLTGWGFEYFKFDGEHALPAYAPRVDRTKLYDRQIDPVAAYRNRLEVIRETIGPNVFVEGCPAGTPLNGIGFFNSYFNGADVYNTWPGMYALFSSINANAFLNHMAVYVMPGEGMELSPPMSIEEAKRRRPAVVAERVARNDGPAATLGTTIAEARTLVSYVALSGVAYPLVSVMPELPPDRIKLLQMTLPTMPILPVDLFSRGSDARYGLGRTSPDDYIHTYPGILDLKVNAVPGVYDVVAVTNWRGEKLSHELDFAKKLGLEPGARYVVFDFWNQNLLGVFKDGMTVNVEPHDTRVLLIHPVSSRPQLVGLARHISGAYSVLDVSWNGARNVLRGSSESIPGEPYSLWFHVPEGFSVLRARARAASGAELAVDQTAVANGLKLTFPGQAVPVGWELTFKR